ncbi:MAG: glycosyl transferase family 1, partial [Nanohaloarchaea archaeon QH_8_44_6]
QVLATQSGVNELIQTEAVTEIRPESGSIAQGLENAVEKDLMPEYESRNWSEMAEEFVELYREIN